MLDRVELTRRGKTVLVAFGVTLAGGTLTAQAFYVPGRVRAGTRAKHEKLIFAVDAFNPAKETPGGRGLYWKGLILHGTH